MAGLGFPIRRELREKGFSEQAIRKLEQLSDFVDTVNRLATVEETTEAQQVAVDALLEEQEDQNLSLATLDDRVDDIETGNGPYVKKTGDAMSGALNVNALLECDSLQINTAEVAAAAAPSTHKVAVNINGVSYFVLLSNV